MFHIDLDPIRTGIERVFDEFFHDRSRPFDHFPGRDLVGHMF